MYHFSSTKWVIVENFDHLIIASCCVVETHIHYKVSLQNNQEHIILMLARDIFPFLPNTREEHPMTYKEDNSSLSSHTGEVDQVVLRNVLDTIRMSRPWLRPRLAPSTLVLHNSSVEVIDFVHRVFPSMRVALEEFEK